MSNGCGPFDNCVCKMSNQMRYPVDKKSLYANKIYDNQIANQWCYDQNPINIEGFGCGFDWSKILQVVVVICLVILAFGLVKDWTAKSAAPVLTGGFDLSSDFDMTPIQVGGLTL